jgi:hypothetical protein
MNEWWLHCIKIYEIYVIESSREHEPRRRGAYEVNYSRFWSGTGQLAHVHTCKHTEWSSCKSLGYSQQMIVLLMHLK